MFYADAFPEASPLLDAETMLEVEFDTVYILIEGDRPYLRRLAATELADKLEDEMWFLGVGSKEQAPGIRDLLRRNAPALMRFIAALPASKSPADWTRLEPDWKRVRELTTEETYCRWKALVEEQQQEPLADPEPDVEAQVA